MIDLGISKMALIGAVALIVIGPEKLPGVARMVGTLLEAHGVDLPPFLHPYPHVLVPVSQKHLEHVQARARELRQLGHDCLVEAGDEPLGAKVRKWKVRGALDIEVFGDKEVAAYEALLAKD